MGREKRIFHLLLMKMMSDMEMRETDDEKNSMVTGSMYLRVILKAVATVDQRRTAKRLYMREERPLLTFASDGYDYKRFTFSGVSNIVLAHILQAGDGNMTIDGDELLSSIRKHAESVKEDLKRIDLEKETTSFMKEAEKVLSDLGKSIERKRSEMERRGVKETVKRDLEDVEREIKRTVEKIGKNM